MYLTTEQKKNLAATYGKSEGDTGTSEVQIAIFSERIKHLTEHLKVNKKDLATERALIQLVSKRRSLLDYLKKTEISRYRTIIQQLKLRK